MLLKFGGQEYQERLQVSKKSQKSCPHASRPVWKKIIVKQKYKDHFGGFQVCKTKNGLLP